MIFHYQLCVLQKLLDEIFLSNIHKNFTSKFSFKFATETLLKI